MEVVGSGKGVVVETVVVAADGPQANTVSSKIDPSQARLVTGSLYVPSH
ncbi:hypothetical protein BH18ACT6_BH18ACT6_06850 [soil metagenome]